MYTLSVCALFKNESHILKEWIEHYLYHGVEHFYLLNDESTDNYQECLEPYLDKVTLINVDMPRFTGRQKDIYNTYMLPRLQETQWLLIVDVDEFVWSPRSIDLKHILRYSEYYAEIQFPQSLYGSNGHKTQPVSVVKSFTKRRACQFGQSRTNGYKYFINSSFPFKTLGVHMAIPAREEDEKNRWIVINDNCFVLNHYSSQSYEYFVNKKCTRTDADQFKTLQASDFPEFDTNEVEDMGLYEQNKELIERLF
jgi:hypothetical protein